MIVFIFGIYVINHQKLSIHSSFKKKGIIIIIIIDYIDILVLICKNFSIIFHLYIIRISYCHLAFQSKWMYIGTERGNVYVVNIDTFAMSGYVINWNKAIEMFVIIIAYIFLKD